MVVESTRGVAFVSAAPRLSTAHEALRWETMFCKQAKTDALRKSHEPHDRVLPTNTISLRRDIESGTRGERVSQEALDVVFEG